MKKISTIFLCFLLSMGVSAQSQNKTKKQDKQGIADQTLQEIQVTGTKSTMKLKVDRKEFDVASMITTAGQSASEVLETIPSVEVDNDGNVSLRGNESVEIRINGRTSGLTSDNRAQILQQLPAESIEKIEIIDNPSAKFSAEGSAGIINIVLKKNRKAGYYGSVQAGANTRGGANTSFNINYNSSKLDAYFNVGYRHMEGKGENISRQDFLTNGEPTSYDRHNTTNSNRGNMIFSRAGLTWHMDGKNDFSLSGMFFGGKHHNNSSTPYYYGNYPLSVSSAWSPAEIPTMIRLRNNSSSGPMRMMSGEFNYRHTFSDTHFIDFVVSHNKFGGDHEDIYQDSIKYLIEDRPVEATYQKRPLDIENHRTEVKLDYENQITDKFKLEAGYNAEIGRENTPMESYIANNWEGKDLKPEETYYNNFFYNLDIHALYTTLSYSFDKFSIMGGLRGEYWKVNTESFDWDQDHGKKPKDPAFSKNYFQLFPSVFMSYQMTRTQQLQLNYTRRLRRPWGGELNNFKNTSDASIVSFGNPHLTPEFSNSFSLNYLKQWDQHSLLVSAYYRPTTDVIQRINYRSVTDGKMYSTSENVAQSLSTGVELTGKSKFGRMLDLTTNVNLYYYKIDAFNYTIEDQTVTGKMQDNFTWTARMIAQVTLPWDISIQASGRYNSRRVLTQGYRPHQLSMDLGAKKNFFNKKLILSINCRDVFDSRKWETNTESETFRRYQLNKRNSRTVNFTLTWNFGNTQPKRRPMDNDGGQDEEMGGGMGGYDM